MIPKAKTSFGAATSAMFCYIPLLEMHLFFFEAFISATEKCMLLRDLVKEEDTEKNISILC